MTASLGEKNVDRRETEVKLAVMVTTIVSVFVVCNSFESIVFILHIQEMLPLDIFQDYLRLEISTPLFFFNFLRLSLMRNDDTKLTNVISLGFSSKLY